VITVLDISHIYEMQTVAGKKALPNRPRMKPVPPKPEPGARRPEKPDHKGVWHEPKIGATTLSITAQKRMTLSMEQSEKCHSKEFHSVE
jgi:hypothetical protein